MYTRNGEAFDILQQHVIDGTTYPRGWFAASANREVMGVTEGPDPAAAPTEIENNVAIMMQLAEIDRKSIRALREGDQARIAALEAQAVELRGKLVK